MHTNYHKKINKNKSEWYENRKNKNTKTGSVLKESTNSEKCMQDSLAEEGPARQAPRERGVSGAGTVRRKVRNQGGSSQGGRQGFTLTCELSDRRAAISQRTGNPTSGSRRSTPKKLGAAVCSEAPGTSGGPAGR